MANQADLIAVSPLRNHRPSASRLASTFLAGAFLVICLKAGAEDVGLSGNRDLRPAADAGDPVAQYRLGKRYYNKACNLPERNAEALKWFRLSAAQGNEQAQERLGHIYFTGQCEAQDYAEAARWYGLAAEHGDREAQLRLAQIYREGLGVPVDLEKAQTWNDLALHCRSSTGCLQSPKQADVPPARAADAVFTDNPDLRAAAERGDPVAQERLAERYYDERRRDPARDAEALKWLRLSAAQGNPKAEARLGYIYYTGRGEQQDFVEAAMWTKRAAEHGDQEAQRRLAGMYLNGKGVVADRKEARRWSDVLARPQRERDFRRIALTFFGVAAFAFALVQLQRDRLSGWQRRVVAAAVHVCGIALLLNTLNTYGLPEQLFPKCGYNYLAASCSAYQNPETRQIAQSLRDWQMVNLIFRFMAMFGFIFDALAVWYITYLCRPFFQRRLAADRD